MKNYFKPHELECKCGCGQKNMHPETLLRLNTARQIADVPFILTSACRCEEHNARVGGSAESAHLATDEHECHAVDIKAVGSRARFLIVSGLIAAGFTRIGIGKDFVHADDDPDKDQRVTWLYS
jgi:hypothetical protein